jgi:type IV secretory pathway VirB4 component
MILPATIKFSTDHYVCGDSYRCVWAIKEYPPTTEELALFSTLADRNNLTIHLYSRMVDAIEQRKIIQNATRKNKLSTGSNDVQENITAEGNLEDVVNLIAELRKNKEPLLHCAVFLELKADSMQKLRELQSEIQMELTRSKMSVDRLTLRQKEGFLTVLPVGYNIF